MWHVTKISKINWVTSEDDKPLKNEKSGLHHSLLRHSQDTETKENWLLTKQPPKEETHVERCVWDIKLN